MRVEYLQSPRQSGKTRYLAEKVAELQDEGHNLVVVGVHEAKAVDEWYDLMFDVGIDPSRFMVELPSDVSTARGHMYALAGIDNADMIADWQFFLTDLAMGMLNDVVTVTHTENLS